MATGHFNYRRSAFVKDAVKDHPKDIREFKMKRETART
jgi:hypothetical protein